MFSLLSHTHGREPVILIHVGSASVGVALAEFHASEPTLYYTSRERLPFQEELNYDRFFEATFTTLEALLHTLMTAGVSEYTKLHGRAPHITKVGLVLSSTWYVSKTLVLTDSRDKPFRVTQEILTTLASSGRQAFEQEVRKGTYPHVGTDAVILEESLIETSLNGYATPDPLQKTTQHLQMSLLVSLMSASFSDRLFQSLDRVISGYSLYPHSYGLTAFSIIRDLFPEEKNFLLVDIDGEVTDVAVVKDEVLSEAVSFPCGQHGVLRCLGKNLGPLEARSKLLHAEGAQGPKKAKEKWLTEYKQALRSLSEHVAIPNRVFLSGNVETLPWFTDVLTTYEGGDAVFAKPHLITPLIEKLFLPHLHLAGGARYDVNLAILCIFFNKAQHIQKGV